VNAAAAAASFFMFFILSFFLPRAVLAHNTLRRCHIHNFSTLYRLTLREMKELELELEWR
jgi:hypothetical protein